MSIKVKLFADLREIVGKKEINASAKNVGELLYYLGEKYDKLGEKLFKSNGMEEKCKFLNILVNGRNIELLEGLQTKLSEEDKIAIFPPIGGG